MSTINDGGPVYPCRQHQTAHHHMHEGISVRADFAAKMMQVLLAEALGDTEYGNRAVERAGGPEAGEAAAFGVVARDAVVAADALIAELQKVPA